MLALVLAIPFFGVLKTGASGSLAPTSLLAGFDYTVYREFVREHGDAVSALISQVKWLAFAYLLFNVLLSGGILQTLASPRSFSLPSFFEGCGRYFARFLRLLFFVLILQALVAAVVYVPLGLFFSRNKTVEVESSLFYIGLGGFLLHLLLFVAVLLIGDYARISLFRNNSTRALRALWQATKFVFRHFGKTYGLYLAVVLFSLALFLSYFLLDAQVTMRTPLTIALILLVQQLVIWLRIGTKVWLMGSELALHTLVQPVENQLTTAWKEEPGPLPPVIDSSPTPLDALESETLPQPG
ncbi:MAG TPA: hypothetical protein VF690_00180 [Hymenobacter sp.]